MGFIVKNKFIFYIHKWCWKYKPAIIQSLTYIAKQIIQPMTNKSLTNKWIWAISIRNS